MRFELSGFVQTLATQLGKTLPLARRALHRKQWEIRGSKKLQFPKRGHPSLFKVSTHRPHLHASFLSCGNTVKRTGIQVMATVPNMRLLLCNSSLHELGRRLDIDAGTGTAGTIAAAGFPLGPVSLHYHSGQDCDQLYWQDCPSVVMPKQQMPSAQNQDLDSILNKDYGRVPVRKSRNWWQKITYSWRNSEAILAKKVWRYA